MPHFIIVIVCKRTLVPLYLNNVLKSTAKKKHLINLRHYKKPSSGTCAAPLWYSSQTAPGMTMGKHENANVLPQLPCGRVAAYHKLAPQVSSVAVAAQL